MSVLSDDENAPQAEKSAALAQISLLRAEAAKIAEQMQIAESVLSACREREEEQERRKAEERRRREQEEERRQEQERQRALEAKRDERGRFADYYLSDAKFVDKIFSATVKCVATNGRATICLYENGSWAWTSGMPTLLYNKLNGRSRSLPSPTYVSLGPGGYYFIRFADGKYQWVGPDSMTEYFEGEAQAKGGVASVAFGDDDCYFLVYKNGGWRYHGDIPTGLLKLIQSRDKKGDLECVSLGSGGAYFLKAKNGRCWWGGTTEKTLAKIGKYKDRLKFLDFGTYDADEGMDDFIVRYT